LNDGRASTIFTRMLIGIAGMVGSGKTTLTHALAVRFGLQLALESVDAENPWLEPYYSGGEESRREYALRLQLHFLATRFASLRRMRGLGGGWVLDRTWYEDAEVFALGAARTRRAAAEAPRLSASAARRHRRAHRRAWAARRARYGEGVLGRTARAIREMDRRFQALPRADDRRA